MYWFSLYSKEMDSNEQANVAAPATEGGFSNDGFPDEEDLLGEGVLDAVAVENGGEKGGFAPIAKHFEDIGHKAFDDPAYYKMTLAGGSSLVQRLHTVFQKLVQAKEPKDRTEFRMQIIPIFWEYIGAIAREQAAVLPEPKKFLLRFGLLHPGILSPEHRKLFSTIRTQNVSTEPVYYLDEWFAGIGRDEITASTTDEAPAPRGNTDARWKELHEKARGKLEGLKGMVRLKNQEKLNTETALISQTDMLAVHAPSHIFSEVSACYSETQRKSIGEIQNLLKNLVKADREVEILLREIENAQSDVAVLEGKQHVQGSGQTVSFDTDAINREFLTIRQMVKMTIGRQGNAFPILSSEYFHCMPNGIGTRENVISVLSWIESIDEEAYIRIHRKQVERIVPYVILLPTYGDFGICWEPFERLNKATSRGRIAIPMYPRNLTVAILTAVADLRWQAAKEKASYYWMEEGLTGNYYQWFSKQKLKGDIKRYFIQDYLLWMTKESEGIQKLDKELRGIFWRYMPFTRFVKEKLKDRNLVYQELYQRDLNRAASDL
jgi:hypothetical protein